MPNLIKAAAALIISAVGVHLVYLSLIRPRAELALLAAAEQGGAVARTLPVVLKDYEQEICIILMFWGIYLILEKCYAIVKHRYLFNLKLIGDEGGEDGESVDGERSTLRDMQSALRNLESLTDRETRDTPLVKTLRTAARRYIATQDAQNTSDAIVTGVEALAARLESGNSMIRYLIWAIPSIGFIGTVRGIGQALSQADQALAGDISGMTNSLGIAFNSTLVALIISIFLMFLLHELQRLQDKLIVDTQAYCEEFLLSRIEKKA
ncbi:MAG: MotA/TolQ/ExbB proton channel family protein [Gammaproteobacteria bacterium]|nr:MotA/TolQ/ExbB proton channel family protein [Gammaproteobacteria bacterium]